MPRSVQVILRRLLSYGAAPLLNNGFPSHTAGHLLEHIGNQDARTPKSRLAVTDRRVNYDKPPNCLFHDSSLRRPARVRERHEGALLLKRPDALRRRASHGEMADLDRGNAHAHRDALPVLAAGADAGVEFEVVADGGDARQHCRPVADEGRALYRRGDLAVFDQVSFRSREDKLAVGDIHLAATEVHRVEAAPDRADDLLGVVRACQHVGIGHARHGDVLVALAAAVARARRPEYAGAQLVLDVAAPDSVL